MTPFRQERLYGPTDSNEFNCRRERKQWLPFEFAESTDFHGFINDMEGNALEQRVVYPFHCNITTRIEIDPTTHQVVLEKDNEGRHYILLIPNGKT